MPFHFEPEFTRQRSPDASQIALVIPSTAQLSPKLTGHVRDMVAGQGPPSSLLPGRMSFHYVPWPPQEWLLRDGAMVDTQIYVFPVKDAVISVFDLVASQNDEFCWSFASSAQRDVLAALSIGQTFDVQFDDPLAEAFHVGRYHFPSGVPNSGYGKYAVHLANDPPRADGFRVTTSFEPDSLRTPSRLPFFFGFRVFGKGFGDAPLPVWRDLLGHAVRQAAHGQWSYCLLYAAFSLESFIDARLADRLRVAEVGDDYIDHVLRVGDREAELFALNARQQRLSKNAVKKLVQTLNSNVFTPRNRIAHGRPEEAATDSGKAVKALKTAVEFVWDWDESARSQLLTPMRPTLFEDMIDDDLLKACGSDRTGGGHHSSGEPA